MSKNRYGKKIDANQPGIVGTLRHMGCSVELDKDDILIGFQGLTFWFELKDDRALDKNGNIKESEIKPNQKILRDTWRGHYRLVSSLKQIIDDMNETFKRCGLRTVKIR